MNIRSFDFKKDYSDVCSWWTKQDWSIISKDQLSGTGFIVENEENKLAATWVFKTNSPIYIMEWTVGNPDVNWEVRSEAVKRILNYASNWAKDQDAKYLLTMSNNKRFIEKLKLEQFQEADTNMTHLLRKL